MSISGRRPNLFVVGAMKAATTSLHAYLDFHSDIFMCEPKEPSYFVPGDQLRIVHPVMEEKGFYTSERRYLELFTESSDQTYLGESSTAYSKLPVVTGVAPRIYEYCPNARIIYVMRDPVSRTISHYWWEVRWKNEKRNLLKALREEPFYRQVSNYSMQLQPYMQTFPREQILTLTFEELTSFPEKTMKRVFEWLGVDALSRADMFSDRLNETPPEIDVPRGLGLLDQFRYSNAWSTIEGAVPKKFKTMARSLSERRLSRSEVPLNEVQAYLRAIHLAEVVELEQMLDRDFPEWTNLVEDNSLTSAHPRRGVF